MNIANPGRYAAQHVYPNPTTGEPIRTWRMKSHSLMYRVTRNPGYGPYTQKIGDVVPYTPPPPDHEEGPAFEAKFLDMAKFLGLVLVGRKERRGMWRAERARYRAIVKARKAT